MAPKPNDIHGRPTVPLEAGRAAGAGLQFAGAIVLFLFAGRWLDSRLGTAPWLLLAGVLIGAVAGFWALYRQLAVPSRGPGDRPEERKG